MACADEQSYEEMISALNTFKTQVEENCQQMAAAGTDCVDNTEDDVAAVKLNAKLTECLARITSTFETVDAVIAALQEEIEKIREAAKNADSAE